MANNEQHSIGLNYPLAQLARALSGTSADADRHVERWLQVIRGMQNGSIQVGSRTPVAAAPSWVTLEVVQDGFATGGFSASGALQSHEAQQLASLPDDDSRGGRLVLNLRAVSDEGRAELLSKLREGRYRVGVPEEAALLVAAWLVDRGESARAQELVDTLLPWFNHLRFYPIPHERALRASTGVSVETVGRVVERLRSKEPQQQVVTMNEALQVWAPLSDRAMALFAETVEGEHPSLRQDEQGAFVRGANGQPIVEGGWPCRHYASDWTERARLLLSDYEEVRRKHQLCGKPERKKENFARLRGYLASCVRDRTALTGRDVGAIRGILAAMAGRHGPVGSERRSTMRAVQARVASLPLHSETAKKVALRLSALPQDEGTADLGDVLAPVSGGDIDAAVPDSIAWKVRRCLEAPLDKLIAEGLLASSEAMAKLLPAVSAEAQARAIDDVALQNVFRESYKAFRRRRSLLLLNYESQVRIQELPWMAAISPWMGNGASGAARATLVEASALAIRSFPQTQLPNKLIQELRALGKAAGLSMPLVEELAVDIFMGGFTDKFLSAARNGGRLLRGTLYERYYDIPYERLLAMRNRESKASSASAPHQEFSDLCEQRAGPSPAKASWTARNGTVIEQAQILTTHNLATLFVHLDLAYVLRDELPALARRCFEWICFRQTHLPRNNWQAEMQLTKNAAYAWRQMIFYLSLVDDASLHEFMGWSRQHLSQAGESFRQRFEPAMRGLELAVAGRRLDEREFQSNGARRFLGWSVGRHWLLPPRAESH